jgi:uncharacterized protein YidB (DUF937 family)
MSLLDTVIGALGQQQPGRGGQADLITAIIGMLGQQGGGGLGGLAGLVDKLQRAGLGDAVNSWVGTGQNQPVAPPSSWAARSVRTPSPVSRSRWA